MTKNDWLTKVELLQMSIDAAENSSTISPENNPQLPYMKKELAKLLAREKYHLDRFRDDEFECHCGCKLNEMQQSFVEKLDLAAKSQGPKSVWIVNRGHSCKKHNAAVGGSPTSTHLVGLAVDIQCKDADDRYEKIMFSRIAGIRRVVVYDDKLIVHLDDDQHKTKGLHVYKK